MNKITILIATVSPEKDKFLDNISKEDIYTFYPESGKHPLQQKEMAKELTNDYKDNPNNLIIDTFSDHLINTIRYLVFLGKINHNDVDIIYIYDDKREDVKISKLGKFVDKNGENSFPNGFYDATLKEIYQINKGV